MCALSLIPTSWIGEGTGLCLRDDLVHKSENQTEHTKSEIQTLFTWKDDAVGRPRHKYTTLYYGPVHKVWFYAHIRIKVWFSDLMHSSRTDHPIR